MATLRDEPYRQDMPVGTLAALDLAINMLEWIKNGNDYSANAFYNRFEAICRARSDYALRNAGVNRNETA